MPIAPSCGPLTQLPIDWYPAVFATETLRNPEEMSPEEIQIQIAQRRAALDAKIHELERRLSPREQMARMWAVTADRTDLPPVAVKTFLAFGMLLNTAAALEVDEVDADWARGIRTRIQAGLFDHVTEENNQ